MHWRRLRPCPSPCNPAYEIGRCEGRSIDKGRIIGLDSSNLSKPPKLCLATGLWRIQRWCLARSGNGPLHRAAARTSSDTNLSRKVFSLPKETRCTFRREIPLGLASCARLYRTLRDGSFEGRFPRHFVPGYDRCCPYGTRLQTFRNSIYLVLFAQGLDVRFAVGIKEFLSDLLPRRSEFGRCNVPVRPAFLGNGP